jgi:DNA-binding transcriptional regulator YbjK
MEDVAGGRKHNPQQRREQICDAAIDVLGKSGARGLSHLRVDRAAGLPAGTTSAYYRTRDALIHATAARITELDLRDLTLMTQADDADGTPVPDTTLLAAAVIAAARGSRLTRARARLEISLQAHRDDALAAILEQTIESTRTMARHAVIAWHDTNHTVTDEHAIERHTTAVLTFIDGVMLSHARGVQAFTNPEDVRAILDAIIERPAP